MACGSDDGAFVPVDDLPTGLINPIDVWSFGPTDAWFLDGSATIHRFDGSTWSTLTAPAPVNCIYALSASDVYLCSNDVVVRYDGAAFTMNDASAAGLDGFTSIWATGPSDIWVVGDDAIVAHYTGTSWQRTIVGSPFKSSIWGSGPSDVYALSTFDLSHYDGNTWTEIELDDGSPAGGDGQVWGTSSSDVWLMNGDDAAHHFDGSTWTSTPFELGDFEAVWGIGDTIWAAGSPGAIIKFDGDWESLAMQRIGAPYLQQMVAVHGSSANDVWVVGHQLGEGGSTGLIYHIGP